LVNASNTTYISPPTKDIVAYKSCLSIAGCRPHSISLNIPPATPVTQPNTITLSVGKFTNIALCTPTSVNKASPIASKYCKKPNLLPSL